jgi:uncharacterized OB-fold protein
MDSFPELDDFLRGCAAGELRIPRCQRCGQLSWPPRPRCGHCQHPAFESARVSPIGQLFSWTVIHRTRDPQFAARTPYAVVIVALTEDPSTRLVGRFTGRPEQLSMAMPLRAVFDGSALPAWGMIT